MNINVIIIIIASVLSFIFFYFKPMQFSHTQTKIHKPEVEIVNFTLYEFDTQKLVDQTIGKRAKKYKDRYEMYQFDFLDNANNSLVHLSANKGVYKKDVLYLNDEVVYNTADGVLFQTKAIEYHRNQGYLQNNTNFFVQYQDKHTMVGKNLYYNIDKQLFHAIDTTVTYHLGNNK